ncbi:MAG: hypothetical protein HY067_19260 [Betaproteobacteria bacterium]|nr:hypothetical protein [Betaproteobacteria bacterium]
MNIRLLNVYAGTAAGMAIWGGRRTFCGGADVSYFSAGLTIALDGLRQ